MNLDAWRQKNFSNIEQRIAWLRAEPEGIILDYPGEDYDILIFKDGQQIQLYFVDEQVTDSGPNISGIMSRIDLDHPLDLPSVYCQAMMLSLAWQDRPRRICVLGFGGGRVPMIFHHYLPEVIIDGVEIDPVIVELAQSHFGIQPDSRMRIFIQDAQQFLLFCAPTRCYDILILDCYTGAGNHPNHLSTEQFYATCKTRLAPRGLVVTNLIRRDPGFSRKHRTFIRSFKHVHCFSYGDTRLLFGTDHTRLATAAIRSRVQQLVQEHQFAFPLLKRVDALEFLTSD